MKKTRMEKGITLIALIITIVVLLILAVVAISSITNDGILSYAQNAAKDYNQAVKNEQEMLDSYIGFFETGKAATTFEEATRAGMLQKTVNSTVHDAYGNKIVVPAGFKIRVDASTNNADTVTEGIVIEDAKGNQFVWIPVGKIYTDTAKTEANAQTITLGRYSWNGSIGTLMQPTGASTYTSEVAITSGSYNFTESQPTSTTKMSKARNINDFYESIMGTAEKEGNGGYYLGRYEAGDSSHTTVASRTGTSGVSTAGTLVCKANQVPYNWILQSDASSKCQSMYVDGYSVGTFSSDLVNSYAWDTAIIFIQTFGTKINSSTYASTLGESAIDTSAPQLTGINKLLNVTNNPVDEQLNIYDMAGNCNEWFTESSNSSSGPGTIRGGRYRYGSSGSGCAGARNNGTIDGNSGERGFRPLIYMGL